MPTTLWWPTTNPSTDSVALAYDERKRSRLKVTLASGAEAGIFLERGDHLHGGDRLAAENGSAIVEILAAPERLIEAVADSPLLFARAAYHLGNRHVPVQILPTDNGGKLRFLTDHEVAHLHSSSVGVCSGAAVGQLLRGRHDGTVVRAGVHVNGKDRLQFIDGEPMAPHCTGDLARTARVGIQAHRRELDMAGV